MFRKYSIIFLMMIFIFTVSSIVAGSEEKIVLRVSWWGSESRHRNTIEAIKLYEELNQNVKIIPEYSGFEGYRNKLFAQIMAGNAPDIFTTVMEWYPDLLAADGMVDITGMVDVSGHNPKYVEACSYDGKMYGVNLSVNSMVMIQNLTLLKELGIEPLPVDEPYSWDELTAKFNEVYEKSGGKVYGAADPTVNREGMGFDELKYYGYTKLAVEKPFPFDNEKFTVTKDEIQDFLEFFDNLRKTGALAPVELSSMNDFSANNLLIQRLVVYEWNWAGTFGRYQDQTRDELEPIPMPVGPNGESGDMARPGLIFSIAKNCKHVEEAARFIEWFTTSPEAAKILRNCRGVLPTTTQREALLESGEVLSETDKKVMAVVDESLKRELKTAYAGPGGYGDLGPITLSEIGQKIAFGLISVEDGAEEFMEAINK